MISSSLTSSTSIVFVSTQESNELQPKQNVTVTANNTEYAGIRNKDILITTAKIYAQQNVREAAFYIKNLSVQDKEDLKEEIIKIAKHCAQRDAKETARLINCFGIQDTDVLVDIAMLCAQKNVDETVFHISKFGIKDEKALVKIANFCVEQDVRATVQCIQNFGIRDQGALIEIVMLCAKLNISATACCIQNFGIRDQEALIGIAEFCAQQNGEETACCIQFFGIKNQGALITIFKLCAHRDLQATVKNIHNFGIKDQEALIKLAMICAEQDAWATAENIHNFGIKDQEALIGIAGFCVKRNPVAITFNIQNFGFKDKVLTKQDKEGLIAIFKLSAQLNVEPTIVRVEYFGIKDKETLIALAEFCAERDTGATVQNIQYFDIQDQGALIKIARLCVQQNVEEIAKNISNFGIQDPRALKKIFVLCISNSAQAFQYAKNFGQNFEPLVPLASCDDKKAKEILYQFFGKDINKDSLPSRFLASVFLFLECEDLAWVEKQGLMEAFRKLRSPELQYLLLPFLETNKETFEKLGLGIREKNPEHKLLRLLLVSLDVEDIFPFYTGSWRAYIRNGPDFNLFIDTLRFLSLTDELSSNEKQGIVNRLKALTSKEEIKRQVSSLQILLRTNQKKENLLQNNWPERAKELFKEIAPIGNVKDFATSFTEKFLSCRQPEAIVLYAAKLQSLKDPFVMEALGRFITHTLNGTFKESRYHIDRNKHLETIHIDRNKHLETIHNSNPSLIEKWKEGSVQDIELNQAISPNFSYTEWMETKLMQDKHLNTSLIPDIFSYFTRKPINPSNLHGLQKRLWDVLEQTDKTQALKLLKQELLLLSPAPEFLSDVDKLLSIQKFQLVDTDDPIDLLLCGTEVSGSCVAISGSALNNRGLLGYLLDGKIRLLAIKDLSGRIKARCLLKLMWDGEQAVLLQEVSYPLATISEEEKQKLKELAKKKANELGIPLVSLMEFNNKFYPKTLFALGGPAPFEYCDSVQGVKPNGCYEVERTCISE